MSVTDELVSLAHYMADEAGLIAGEYFRRRDLDVILKQDETPVTFADRAIELRMREIVETRRPEDGIIGEEFGNKDSKSGLTWVIDPVDGTKSFTIGRPSFGTLIGLCDGGTPVLGVIDQPILRERWIGYDGKTAYNGSETRTRKCPHIRKAIFGTGSPSQISAQDPHRFERIDAACRYSVLQGDCYFYGLMANGGIDVIVEDQLGVYDYIALVPVVEGAGGKITDWNGDALTLDSGSNLVASGDPDMHSRYLDLVG